ncbi:MAG: methionine synthase [Cyanobacteria bacterium RUI128]|nr:methionine synthase [Cyanobacteria bacterium RUI128]
MGSLIRNILQEKILILDGAMGTMIQKYNLSEKDYRGELFKSSAVDLKGNNELLSLTKPEVIKEVHSEYLKAGADIIECNTFSANSISQKDYNLESMVEELNRASVRIAREVAEEYSTPDKPRFIAGSIGPTNKSASISPDVMNPAYRDVSFDELVECYSEQIKVLAEEGVDVFLVETIFDTLNAKAAIYAVRKVLNELKKDIPLMLSVTLTDKSGRTLSGQTLEAFYYSVEFGKPMTVGLNCSMGIDSMIPYVEELSEYANCGISLYANAGLPNEFGGYDETPEHVAEGYKYLAEKGCLNVAGGCCGTTPEHIRAIHDALKGIKPRTSEFKKRTFTPFCGLEPFIYDGNQNFIMIGERTNVTGSKKFARLISEGNYAEGVNIARQQVENGANIIDICMDSDLSDSKSDMCSFLNLIASEPDISKVPVMIDSSNFDVIEAGLKCIQSKPVVNSISLKVGEDKFIKEAKIIKELGGCVVVMAFDENGQATGVDDRVEIVSRAYELLTEKCGYEPTDIIFDLNVFPLATGMKEHNNNAVSFIEALKILKKKFPLALFSGGISNISFSFRGMNRIREAIHTVFLYHAIRAGLTMGIVNAGMLMTYDEIEEPLKTLVEDVVLNKREDASERLLEYAEKASDDNRQDNKKTQEEWRNQPVDKRIQYALIKGNTSFIEADLEEALGKYTPLEIIEGILLEGMNIVGEYFGSGKMFLPQVVKSSRIMKEIVDKLQKDFEQSKTSSNIGTVVLATVKGDVHDIGKNILSLILVCNGFKVIDLGVMVNSSDILESARKYNANIIALSGLITPSLEEMQKVAERMEKEGFKLPALMVGGATTSKKHTAIKIAPNYNGLVVHTTNASEAVVAAQKIVMKDEEFIKGVREEQEKIRNGYS